MSALVEVPEPDRPTEVPLGDWATSAPVRGVLEGRKRLAGFGWAPDGDRPPRARTARDAVAEALAHANPRRAEDAGRLRDPDCVAVVAGQQPGVLGGPLLTLLKALSVVAWAERLRAEGRPAVPVFWVASQDHDAAEIRQVALPGGRAAAPEEAPDLVPVGPATLGAWGPRAVEALAGTASDDAFLARLGALHTPEATHTDAFVGTLRALLGDEAPLFLDPMAPALARAAAPRLAQLLHDAERVDAHLAERGEPAGATLVFRHDDEGRRRRLLLADGGLELRGTGARVALAQATRELEAEPARFSPSALGRPLVQEALLGPTLHVAGPGELLYWRPLGGLFAAPPTLTLRGRVAVATGEDRDALSPLGLSVGELLRRGPAAFDRALAGPAHAALLVELDALLARHAPRFRDGPASEGWERTRGSIETNARRFGRRLRRAARRTRPEETRAAEAARDRLLPGGRPQDTALSAAWLRAHHGPSLVPALRRALTLDPGLLGVAWP